MGGIVRILLIVVAVVAVVVGVSIFALPSRASKTEVITIERPAPSVIARLATMPAGTPVSDGVTQTVTGTNGNVVTADLTFPDGQTGRAVYTVTPAGEGSEVAVRIESPLGFNPLTRIQGLSGAPAEPYLQAAVASVSTDLNQLPPQAFTGLTYEVTNVAAQPFFFIQNCSPQDSAAIKDVVAQSLLALRPLMRRHGLVEAGPPVAVETSWENNQYCFQIGLPYTGTPPRVLAVGTAGQTPAGQAIRVHYTGPEENVIPTYDQMEALIASARLEQGRSFEVYFDDPTTDTGSVNRDIYYLVAGDASQLARIAPSAGVPPPAAALTAPAAAPAPAPEAAPPAATPEAAPAAPAPAPAAPAQPAPAPAQ